MNRHPFKSSFVVGMAAIGVIAGIAVGFFIAHKMMGDRGGMTMGTGGISAPPGRAGEMGEMKRPSVNERDIQGIDESGRGMEGMSGMPIAPSGAVAIPAVMRQLIGVRSAPVAFATLEQDIRAVGTVGYDERGLSQVSVKVSGWVRDVFVNSIGQPVHKGAPLFTLYSPDLLATQDEYLLAVRAQDQLAASPLADVKTNAASLVASSRARLQLWDVTDRQMGALARRGTAEPLLTVYAPSSGIVLKREALPGKYVEPGTTLYEVADLSTVWVSVDVYEYEMAAVKINQPASVTFAAYPGERFQGTVAYIYPTLNSEARTVRVRLELANPGLKLKPGMYGNVTVQTEVVRTLAVPKEAVLETGLRQLVFLDRGQGRYEPAAVKLGRRSQDSVEVLKGLKEGDRIVTSANFLLDAESKLASASSMQAMMGRIGMGDWQMRGAHEGKMEGMDGMQGMGGMPGMEMGSNNAMTGGEARQVNGLMLSLTTVTERPKAGDVFLRLKVADPVGKPVTDAQVVFVYTMPMPGMTDSRTTARHTKDGLYEGKVLFGMGGVWIVTVNLSIPGRPPIAEQFQFSVAAGGL
ncbi:MAG: efflux RND transporter periplasmic adaptor subunit [Nitrospirota bacterium]|nr:efflux RND transporter periplasmic adaptor subunit [Nitrospirota bacterium]MDP2382268.1 efflux RND transporter periplasmic adaptor subunit [Nitrospirota bacterium]